nr:MAG TPA: hypothetical protein [Caudoviricetes sp.]
MHQYTTNLVHLYILFGSNCVPFVINLLMRKSGLHEKAHY